MMTVNWIVETEAFDDSGIHNLVAEIKSRGLPLIEVKNDIIKNEDYSTLFDKESCTVSFCSLNLMRKLFRTCSWIPTGYCTFDNLKCSTYYQYFKHYLLNDTYIMLPLNELIRFASSQSSWLEGIFYGTDGSGELFIRPDSGAKEFAGTVLRCDKINLDNLGYGFYHENLSLMTVISSAKKIDTEWRLFVADGKVISGSQYMINMELEVDPHCDVEAMKFAQDMLDKVEWRPDRLFCMDICQSEGDYYLLELNSFSCCGLYDCDVGPIVECASKIAEEEWNEVYNV